MVNVLNFDHRRITEVLWVTVVVVWPLTRRRNCLCGLISLNFYLIQYKKTIVPGNDEIAPASNAAIWQK
jgi:hypothetical protein